MKIRIKGNISIPTYTTYSDGTEKEVREIHEGRNTATVVFTDGTWFEGVPKSYFDIVPDQEPKHG